MEQDEPALVRQALAGDPSAFDRLVEIHTARLFRLVRRFAPDAAEAESLVQEAWLRAWQHRRRCSPDRPFFPWLASIATNLTRDAWRKRRPLDFADVGDEIDSAAADDVPLEARFEADEARARLADCVRDLRPEWRVVIALRYDGGLEYAEIAAVLGVPLNTVRTHLRRARAALRRCLEEENA